MKRVLTIILLVLLARAAWSIDLDQSLELARQNNVSLLLAREQVLKADQSYYDVRGNLLPHLNLVGAYQLGKTYLPDSSIAPPMDFSYGLDSLATNNDHYLAGTLTGIYNGMLPSSPMDEGSLALSLQLEQVLFTGGKLMNGLRTVDRYRQIQGLNYKIMEQEVVLATTKIFYNCLLADKLVQVQSEALDTAQRHLARAETFAAEGLVSEFDLLQARLEVAKLDPQLLQARNARDLALAAFRQQIGISDETTVPEGEFVLPPPLDVTLDEALLQGVENRLELDLADMGTQIAELGVKSARGNYLPNLALQASASLYTAADEFAIESDDFGTNYTIGLGLSLPLFDGFSNLAKSRSARHDYQMARLQQKDAGELIRLQIRQCHQNLRHAVENYLVQEQNLRMAERSLQLAQVRYENQVGIQLEIFTAQTTLSAIRLQYYNAINEVISATRELQKAMGILL